MSLRRELAKLCALFRRPRPVDDLEEEIRSHLEMEEEENLESGMPPDEAHYAALRRFGNVTLAQERSREMWGWNSVETLWQDIRYGLRMLRKNPGFTAVAVVTLALGIGTNTTIFTVVNAVLLRPLPYPEPEQIMRIALVYKGQLGVTEFSAKQFEFWKAHSDPFQYLAATVNVGFNLGGVSTPERIKALRVSAAYFQVFGVHPKLGREFLPEEDRIGGPDVAILSHGLWVRDFGANPNVIGRSVALDGAPFTVVGVMPSGFQAMSPADLWTTIGQVATSMGSGGNYEVIARLKPTFSRGRAASYMATLAEPYVKEFAPDYLAEVGNIRFGAFPYNYMLTNDVRTPLAVLFGAVGLVLLIACVNVANLQMARASARAREIAVRAALGAARSRILRQLLTENLLLGLLGASCGLLLAYLGVHTLLPLVPADLPHAQNISLDQWALAFTVLVAILAGALFGIVPSLKTSRVDLGESLKESGARGISSRHRVGSALVAMEVGLSLLLLVGSGLLIKTFTNLLRTSPGFDRRNVLSVPIWTSGTRYKSADEFAHFYDTLLSRITSIPGVKSSAVIAGGLPLEHGGNSSVNIADHKDSEGFQAEYREISPEYFHTLSVSLRQGRFFTDADSQTAHRVVIINETFAREHFPARSPVGAYLSIDDTKGEIVGVVGDVKTRLNEPALATFFVPVAQVPLSTHRFWEAWFPTCVLVRTAGNPLSLSRAVEGALRATDPNLAIGQVRSMEEVLSFSIAFQRFLMTLMAVFASLALVLACVGLYGVISYSVSRRTHEFGIRMALGATRRDILVAVIRQGFQMTIIGMAVGLAGALGLTRLLRSVLFGVAPSDPGTFTAVSVLLISVSLLASYMPARRATKVDPMVALRYE